MGSVAWTTEYSKARRRVRAIVEAAPDGADLRVPACPAWTVHDLVAHMCGLGVALAGGDLPGADTQSWIDGLVQSRKGRQTAALLDEWDGAAVGVERFLAAMGDGGGQLVYDVVAHEHDLCHALGRSGDRTSTGVTAAAVAMSALLAKDLASHNLAGIEIDSGGRCWVAGDEPAGLAVTLEPFELIRVFGGRRSEAQVRVVPWRGDIDVYLPAIAHLPFPAADLIE